MITHLLSQLSSDKLHLQTWSQPPMQQTAHSLSCTRIYSAGHHECTKLEWTCKVLCFCLVSRSFNKKTRSKLSPRSSGRFPCFQCNNLSFFSGFWKISNREMLLWGMVGSTQPSTIPSLLWKHLQMHSPLYSTVQLQILLQNCKTQQRMKLNTLGLTCMKYTVISQVSLFKHLIYCKTFSTRRCWWWTVPIVNQNSH